MTYRLIGAVLIVTGCGSFGISLVMGEKHQERILQRLLSALKFMESELQYRLTPLPELLTLAGKQAGGEICEIFCRVSQELNDQILPDVCSCMQKVLQERADLVRSARKILRKLGQNLGAFDLPGQLDGLQEAEEQCKRELKKMEDGKAQRFRSYETLGFCTGLALAILFI